MRGQRVAYIATDFYRGSRSIVDSAATFAEIRELKKSHEIVIVSAHAGAEGATAGHTPNRNEIYLSENRGNSIAFSHAIAAGADLILISGPHVPRGLEVFKDRLIAYSLGNFLTERGISVSGIQGVAPLLEVELDEQGRFETGYVSSFQQIRGRPLLVDPNRRALKVIAALSAQDFPNTRPAFRADGAIAPYTNSGSIIP